MIDSHMIYTVSNRGCDVGMTDNSAYNYHPDRVHPSIY